MPKQILKIDQFHGGLNSNSDPRDIAPNELSQAQDIMIDEIGKVRTMGSNSSSGMPAAKAVTITEGHGLFYFSHDRLGAQDTPAAGNATGDDYLALANSDAGADIEIYSNEDTSWSSGARIVLGDGSSTTGMKAVYYYADGNLRVGDGAFGSDKRVQWYGYINRYFYGDGTSGSDTGTLDQGVEVDKWYTGNSSLEPLTIKVIGWFPIGGTGYQALEHPTAADPIVVGLDFTAVSHKSVVAGTDKPSSENDSIYTRVTWAADQITDVTTTPGGMDTFATVGDTLVFSSAANNANNDKYFTVTSTTDTVLEFDEAVTGTDSNDFVYISNLSKGGALFWNKDNPNFEIAVSTLYDNSKQESPLNIFSSAIDAKDLVGTAYSLGKLKFTFNLYTGVTSGSDAGDGVHLNHPRVSGFKIYMRHENTTNWYLQAYVDITKGITLAGEKSYNMWADAIHATGSNWDEGSEAYCETDFLTSFRQIQTYETETGFDQENSNIGFNADGLGFKTAVVANRRVYVGNVSIKDDGGIVRVLQDAILKSPVNSFDVFSIEDKIEATVNDGSSIIKLEEYADRLLEFKQDKMTLINISQEIEFLEDTFMHKGVSVPSATCKTDYGIAWVNENGCYLYDGQRVNDLLEKDGIQIIKESEWSTFIGTTPMIGYVPKKRQLIVATSAGTGSANGNIYLHDLVTKSWVRGDSKLTDNQKQTNFITDWNGDLVHAHTSDTGTVVKWSDASSATTTFSLKTKDIDFGEPGIRKKIYRVYITYKGSSDTNVDVFFDVDGGTSLDKQFENGTNFSSNQLAASATWAVAELKPRTSSQANNKKSFRLKFVANGSVASDFEINDISIVYRLKNIR